MLHKNYSTLTIKKIYYNKGGQPAIYNVVQKHKSTTKHKNTQ